MKKAVMGFNEFGSAEYWSNACSHMKRNSDYLSSIKKKTNNFLKSIELSAFLLYFENDVHLLLSFWNIR